MLIATWVRRPTRIPVSSFIRALFFCFTVCFTVSSARSQDIRWSLGTHHNITWQVHPQDKPHTDHIEMSGNQLAAILTYGVDANKKLVLRKQLVFPMLRTIPNDTHGSLQLPTPRQGHLVPLIDGQGAVEYPVSFSWDGVMTIESKTNEGLTIKRVLYPSTTKAAFIETVEVSNTGTRSVRVEIPAFHLTDTTDKAKGTQGSYILDSKVEGSQTTTLQVGEQVSAYVVYSGRVSGEPYRYVAAPYELEKRKSFLAGLRHSLVLETPNDTLNRMFEFAKVRATESIFDTRGGLMHGPGGGRYYAAIWANDQAEYMNPFLPFLGNPEGNESAINSFRHFARFMNPDYRPIPSSIIAEGTAIWNGAGDRGDQAMIAYGASLFALAYADQAVAKELWPLIEWCLEFLRRQTNDEGVINSNSDELEGRFPAGKANLSTNALAYGALLAAADLARALGNQSVSEKLKQEAMVLRANIDRYFGAKVEGYDTYRYYKENVTLRAWICLPLVMGIDERKDETIRALLSDRLWSVNGILTESGDSTFWDRGTLYAFTGLFSGGATDTALPYFNYYSANRLLGQHVPYAVEAWPEGNQRHLSAESGLYCRVVTEGLFGITPKGFKSFSIRPQLPSAWNEMALRRIKAFDADFDLVVKRRKRGYEIHVVQENSITQKIRWDGMGDITIKL